MNLPEHIKYIRERCIDAIANNKKMSVADWRTGEGLSMSFNEAIEIVNEIDRLKAENAEFFAALKTIVEGYETDGMEGMMTRDEVFYNTAKAAIEKIETP
jgi:hypothetical protein